MAETPCADPESFVRGGQTQKTFFFLFFFLLLLVEESREDPNITISGPSSTHMAFRWRADNVLKLNAGYVAL